MLADIPLMFLLMMSLIAVPIIENAPPELDVAIEMYFVAPNAVMPSAKTAANAKSAAKTFLFFMNNSPPEIMAG